MKQDCLKSDPPRREQEEGPQKASALPGKLSWWLAMLSWPLPVRTSRTWGSQQRREDPPALAAG